MKIIIINGSPRKNGNTGKVLQLMAEKLKQKQGITLDYISLSEYNMRYCRGCGHCFKFGGCVIKNDGLEQLSKNIESCDGLIIGSPTFVGDISAQLKTLLDRGHFVLEQLLHNKYTFLVSTYENASGTKVITKLKQLTLYSGGSVSGSLLIKVQNKNFLHKMEHIIGKHVDRFYKNVKAKNGKKLHERLISHIARYLVIKPFLRRKKDSYQAVLNRWWFLGI